MRFVVLAAAVVGVILYARRAIDPSLRAERRHPGGPTIDTGVLLAMRLSALAMLVVLVIDTRVLHWSDTVPSIVEWVGVVAAVGALVLLAWSMSANRYFSPAIRIQYERGHQLVSAGPYAYMRHPGYLAMMSLVPAFALAGGSWAAVATAAIYALLIIRRVSVEDRFLREHLDGYTDYAQRVRHRLLPGIW